jgi:phosphatidylserine decarboxylase|tara:strand:+ start:38 stop:709 length:672 start_codon:yes stop_codon:yes gene_type:complete
MKNKDLNSKFYIHPEGWKFAFIFFVSSLFMSLIYFPLAYVGYLLTLFTLWFFRNPERKTPKNSNYIISSADGKVCLIDNAIPPQEVQFGTNQMLRICVFMNVFNVHINRSPIEGKIDKVIYKKGSFFNASLDKASEKNERSSMIISNTNGTQLVVVQIAGLIARRILSFVSDNQYLDQGERYGLIRFGSRVDIYMPLNSSINCKVGDKVIAGESVLAILAENQ